MQISIYDETDPLIATSRPLIEMCPPSRPSRTMCERRMLSVRIVRQMKRVSRLAGVAF